MAKKKISETNEVVENQQEKQTTLKELSIEQRLVALYSLQKIDANIDEIRRVRGELPLEVQDLEDGIAGLNTRISNFSQEVETLEKQIEEKKSIITESKELIKKYTEQQNNVRNSREFDALSKEIEYQDLEIQLAEKRIKEYSENVQDKKLIITQSQEKLKDRTADLDEKKAELDNIIKETEKEEKRLIKKSDEQEPLIETRLLNAYKRIRKNARNGLAVVKVERDACGGCFSKIPPQRHLDIRAHKKIIVCEYCGRILIDSEIDELAEKLINE